MNTARCAPQTMDDFGFWEPNEGGFGHSIGYQKVSILGHLLFHHLFGNPSTKGYLRANIL